MFYRALKNCRFDRDYAAGDLIPGDVILRPKDLLEMKAIELAPNVDGFADSVVSQIAKSLEKATTLIQEKTTAENVPQQAAESDEVKSGEVVATTVEDSTTAAVLPTNAQLMAKQKSELVDIAKSFNLPVDNSLTKKQLVEAILMKQKAV